jgi:hypothetical protein
MVSLVFMSMDRELRDYGRHTAADKPRSRTGRRSGRCAEDFPDEVSGDWLRLRCPVGKRRLSRFVWEPAHGKIGRAARNGGAVSRSH